MARASTPTLLALDHYARIMGITPPHFNQAAGPDGGMFPVVGSCTDVWWQYAWQDIDQVSREDLARAIDDAEEDIAEVLGYYPAPKWISNEMHQYERFHRRDLYTYGQNIRGQFKSVKARWGRFISAGQRATAEVDSGVAVTYSDPDGDGYDELATISTTTTLTDRCEIKVYFAGEGGNQEWEIRPAKTVTLSGGTVTFTFDAWQLLDPDLWEQFPGAGLLADVQQSGAQAINVETAGNYVTTVDIYREYTDFTQSSAQFYWEPKPQNLQFGNVVCNQCSGSGCVACELTTQTGCSHVRDVNRGIVVPTPATYDADNAQWSEACWSECREPDQVKIWYYAGELSEKFLRDETCEPLNNSLANAIAWLATARLERPLCACNNSQALSVDLQRDLTFTPPDGGVFFLSESDLDNPFGTRKGEIMAWRRVKDLTEKVPGVALA
jgi:hypothetical protein